jgi:hypothetical protein
MGFSLLAFGVFVLDALLLVGAGVYNRHTRNRR